MRYEIGDKIKIKTWDEMVEEFGIKEPDIFVGFEIEPYINSKREYTRRIEEDIRKLDTNRTLTVTFTLPHKGNMEYGVKESSYIIDQSWISERVSQEEKIIVTRGINRFELMDLE